MMKGKKKRGLGGDSVQVSEVLLTHTIYSTYVMGEIHTNTTFFCKCM